MLVYPFPSQHLISPTTISKTYSTSTYLASLTPLVRWLSASFSLSLSLYDGPIVILFPRLWLERKQQGSIVITSSMSSQIINKAAEATPLAQVNWTFVFW